MFYRSLEDAAFAGDVDMFIQMYEQLEEPIQDFSDTNIFSKACLGNQLVFLQQLDTRFPSLLQPFNCILFFIQHGNVEAIKYFLRIFPPLDHQTLWHESSFLIACEYNQPLILQALFEAKCTKETVTDLVGTVMHDNKVECLKIVLSFSPPPESFNSPYLLSFSDEPESLYKQYVTFAVDVGQTIALRTFIEWIGNVQKAIQLLLPYRKLCIFPPYQHEHYNRFLTSVYVGLHIAVSSTFSLKGYVDSFVSTYEMLLYATESLLDNFLPTDLIHVCIDFLDEITLINQINQVE